MDPYLLGWARAVKARPRGQRRGSPPLWLFTDATRDPDPCAAIARLPRGLCGVVLRHDDMPGGVFARACLGRAVAGLCRERRLALAVAGDWRLAARLGAALHLRGGRISSTVPATVAPRWLRRATASAHDAREAVRGRRAGAALVFVSPLFPTRSHPGALALGPCLWSRLAKLVPEQAAALGGIAGRRVRALPPRCRAVGAIAAFLPR